MANFSQESLPADGRFGSGPSKVREAQVKAVTASPLGTSHRKPPVKNLVGSIREGMRELFSLPDGYEVLLGNGGATAIWDAIPFTLVEKRAQCAVIGEFSQKAAKELSAAPWLEGVEVLRTEPGTMILNHAHEGIDAYLYAHNETSTGAMSPLVRYGTAPISGGDDGALTIVDGTSIAGGAVFDVANVDFYYFSPQKCFGSDGGLWIALASPAALERIERLAAERWVPDFLNLQLAVNNSRKDQTLNTPAVATIAMLEAQVQWMLTGGGLAGMEARSKASSDAVYSWASERPYANSFIQQPEYRSITVTTTDFDEAISVPEISRQLREAGVVDVDPYRSLGRNQLRIATFPAIETDDVLKLLSCIDALV
ncbi:MAG: phosphoserine transaminase [Actinomycetaceae bacterium]|nr:phosphoserine transaminase [Arcanobacterium sp.]MDD7686616.1 phosphoserine transaminase [Actinomycetaceae bacterium]MDY5273122.1 phosphoserine transaminase [Arcanobacterium sp.]